MAIKNYQYRAMLDIIKGGYPGEETGTIPDDANWHTTTNESGKLLYKYYYRDSLLTQNQNSSRVVVEIEDDWTASVDNSNNLTINVATKILSIVRDDVRGVPSGGGQGTFNIYVRRTEGGPVLAQFLNDNIDVAHTISGEINLGSYSFTIPPGMEASRGTIYYYNDIVGSDLDDAFWMGISFKNILPPDYRPGKTYTSTNTDWLSHNRASGWAGVWNGSAFKEMRTESGNGIVTGNPPYIYGSGAWRNQRKIGTDA